MQKNFKFQFKVTQQNLNSMRNNIFNADTQFNISGKFTDYSYSSTDYKYRSLNNYRKFLAGSKPLITLTPNNKLSAGYGGQEQNKFIQLGLMQQYVSDTTNLIPYIRIVKQKSLNTAVSALYHDYDPQVSVFPLVKYDDYGDPTFTIYPYIPYEAQLDLNIHPDTNSLVMEVMFSNMYKSSLRPQYCRWHLRLSGDIGYNTGNNNVDRLLRCPFYVYPIGMLQQSSLSAIDSALTGFYNSTQLTALKRWYTRVYDQNQLYCLGKWERNDIDNSFIRSLYGSTADTKYGIKFVSQGVSKFPQSSNIDNLQFSTDFYEQDIDNNFKNLSKVGDFGSIGYNYITQRQDIISKKRDGRIIRDTAQIKVSNIDKGLYIASLGNKTIAQTVTMPTKFTTSWWQKIYAGMGNYYNPSITATNCPVNTMSHGSILFHMPWALWDASNYKLKLAPVIVGPLRSSASNNQRIYNLFATHSITSSTIANRGPNQISTSSVKAGNMKFGLAYQTTNGTQFYFDNTLTGLTGSNQLISLKPNDYQFYSINRNGQTVTFSVNGYPFASVTSLSSSYSGDITGYFTFNHSIYVVPSATGFQYAGIYNNGSTGHVMLNNLGRSGWRQELQFPVQMMDFNIWTGINQQFAKLANVALTKKTGNLALDYISAKSSLVSGQSQLQFDWQNDLFTSNYTLSAYRYDPPSSLSFSSGTGIGRYDIDVPFVFSQNKITDITYTKSNKLGPIGSQYYTITVNRYLQSNYGSSDYMLYVGQTGTNHLNRMNSISQVKSFRDNYLNNVSATALKTRWNNNYSSLSSISAGYSIGMAEDLCYTHSLSTGLGYYTNIYPTTYQSFNGSSGTFGQSWLTSRYALDAVSGTTKYIQFKIDVPIVYFKNGATNFDSIVNGYTPYDITFNPTTGLMLKNQYPSSSSISAYGYYGSGNNRGYNKNIIYSYAARYSSRTASSSTNPATGGMWKALQIGNTVQISDISMLTGLKMRFVE